MCGDSTKIEDVRLLMNGVKCDLLLTDPPYNVAVSNSQGMTIENDNLSPDEFNNFLDKCFDCAYEVMRDGAAFYIWHASSTQRDFENALNKSGLEVRQQLIWVKNQFNIGRQDYQWRHEPCFYGWKDGKHYFHKKRNKSTVFDDTLELETMGTDELRELIKNIVNTVIYADKPTSNSEHPTMKPIPLMVKQIQNSSRVGDKVLDLFGGSGSTLIACEELNRQCYVMEYDPKYVDVIIKRWETLTGEKAVLLNGELQHVSSV